MGHEGSNERASDNVRRVGCAFRFKKKEDFLTISFVQFHRLTCMAADSDDRGRCEMRLNGAILKTTQPH